jgi:large-conductance mechanosensitive channel
MNNSFFKNFYEVILSQDLVNISIGLTIATSFTDVIKAMNVGVILPILTIFSKKPHLFQIAPIISSIFLFLVVTFLCYVLILLPINKLRNKLGLKNKEK